LALASGACARTLPDQDRRITATSAAAKMTAEDLWKDYQSDAAGAARRYHGKALEISGNVTGFSRDRTTNGYVSFRQKESSGVQANLLDDQAAAILSGLKEGDRLTLKCFCEGLFGDVILKSCVRP
jgi:hypothetical protein